jgi:hypothetical protein
VTNKEKILDDLLISLFDILIHLEGKNSIDEKQTLVLTSGIRTAFDELKNNTKSSRSTDFTSEIDQTPWINSN